MEWQNGQIPGQVEVHYYGYDKAFDAWVSLNMLKSKALPKDKKVRHSGGKELWCAKRSQINTIIMQVLHLENTHGKKPTMLGGFGAPGAPGALLGHCLRAEPLKTPFNRRRIGESFSFLFFLFFPFLFFPFLLLFRTWPNFLLFRTFQTILLFRI